MSRQKLPIDEVIKTLDQTVAEAVEFFKQADENLADGYQTARDVISHLVYQHEYYLEILKAVAAGKEPQLLEGTLKEINAEATRKFADVPIQELADRLAEIHKEFNATLKKLPNFDIEFPFKQGGRFWSVSSRLIAMESHIRNHIKRQRRAALLVAGRVM
jgi:hypothetical protein